MPVARSGWRLRPDDSGGRGTMTDPIVGVTLTVVLIWLAFGLLIFG
jgi:hypothetical protein